MSDGEGSRGGVGVRYRRYKQSQARLAPHVDRTAHGGAVAGLHLSF